MSDALPPEGTKAPSGARALHEVTSGGLQHE